MATRKQKNQLALTKRQQYLDELQTSNARALKRAKDKREREAWEAWRDNHDKRHQGVGAQVSDCPLCKAGVALSRAPKAD